MQTVKNVLIVDGKVYVLRHLGMSKNGNSRYGAVVIDSDDNATYFETRANSSYMNTLLNVDQKYARVYLRDTGKNAYLMRVE